MLCIRKKKRLEYRKIAHSTVEFEPFIKEINNFDHCELVRLLDPICTSVYIYPIFESFWEKHSTVLISLFQTGKARMRRVFSQVVNNSQQQQQKNTTEPQKQRWQQ